MDGRVLAEIHFDGFWDWFVHVTPVEPLLKNHPTYLIAQVSHLFGGLITLIHALRGGGRWKYLWLAALLQGLVIEAICFVAPDVDNYWHSQTPVMFLGRRLPLHIVIHHAFYTYQASVAAAQLRLPRWAEPFAVGLLMILIDIPYDIVSVKFVHWTWHDTDPNIADRHYWCPWNSYYFYLSFFTSFTFWFHSIRNWLDKKTPKWQASRFSVEMTAVTLSAVLGPLGGICLFIPIYHPLHDLYKIHSEVTFFIFFSLAVLIVWVGEKNASNSETLLRWRWMLLLSLVVHYSVYLGLVVFGHPEREVITGLHEPIGPCNLTKSVHTPLGTVLKKSEYLCATNYNEKYFDFHCAPGGVPKGKAKWYTICGTPFDNRAEYIAVISTISVLALGVFFNIYFNTSKNKDAKTLNVKKFK